MQNAPIHVLRGRVETAVYREMEVHLYSGHPLIEALPPILDPVAAADAMALLPTYSESDREHPNHLRLHHIEGAQQFFEPLDCHIDLEQRFSRMIRSGYLGRNLAIPGYWAWVNRQIARMEDEQHQLPDLACEPPPNAGNTQFRAMANGFHLIGLAGTGKTTSVERVLQTYPQVICHRHYQGNPFTHEQIVWLRLSCPFDGSVKGLCDNMFQAIDDVCGTRYGQKYGGRRRTTLEMIPSLARVSACHSLGVLVIDEIQNLRGAKPRRSTQRSGLVDNGPSSHEMLKFFVQLNNTLGLPIVLIGTHAAQSVLTGELHSMRRGCGQGAVEWNRMNPDHTWQYFLEGFWSYQYTRTVTPLTPALADALYFETQGIADFAIKVYLLTQMRAVTTGIEAITEELIHSVGQDALAPATKVLKALRDRNHVALRDLPDIRPLDIAQFLDEARSKLASEVTARRRQKVETSDSAVPDLPLPEAPVTPPARRRPKATADGSPQKDFSLEGYGRSAQEFLA